MKDINISSRKIDEQLIWILKQFLKNNWKAYVVKKVLIGTLMFYYAPSWLQTHVYILYILDCSILEKK
jgi:hypothetical protein